MVVAAVRGLAATQRRVCGRDSCCTIALRRASDDFRADL